MRGHGPVGLRFRYGWQTQAHLPRHLFFSGRYGRNRRTVHQDRGIFRRAENRKSRTEILRGHRQLLRVHATVYRPGADTGRRVRPAQAGHLRAQAFRRRNGRRPRVPLRSLFPLLRGTSLHGQHVLPDRHAGGEEEPPVLLRRQEVARLPREDPQGARPVARRRRAGEVPEQGRGERVRRPLLRHGLQEPHRVDDQLPGRRRYRLDGRETV